MTDDRTESLIREPLAHEANRAVDSAPLRAQLLRRAGRPAFKRVPAALTAAAVAAVAIAAVVVTPQLLGGDPVEQPAAPAAAQSIDNSTLVIAGMDDDGWADAVLLARVRSDGASVVSLPRDTLVEVPGHGQARLSEAYQLGREAALDEGRGDEEADHRGATTLVDTIEELTGTTADHYLLVDTSVVGPVTTAVGGVEVCVNETQHDPFSGADLEAGKQTLSGDQALAFLRQRRGLPEGDLDRVVRLQAFAESLFASVGDARVSLPEIAETLDGHVLTDPKLDVLALAEQFSTWKRPTFATATIPIDDPTAMVPELGAVIGVDEAEVREFVGSFLDGHSDGGDSGEHGPGEPRCVN